jgi:hypothetical protein
MWPFKKKTKEPKAHRVVASPEQIRQILRPLPPPRTRTVTTPEPYDNSIVNTMVAIDIAESLSSSPVPSPSDTFSGAGGDLGGGGASGSWDASSSCTSSDSSSSCCDSSSCSSPSDSSSSF